MSWFMNILLCSKHSLLNKSFYKILNITNRITHGPWASLCKTNHYLLNRFSWCIIDLHPKIPSFEKTKHELYNRFCADHMGSIYVFQNQLYRCIYYIIDQAIHRSILFFTSSLSPPLEAVHMKGDTILIKINEKLGLLKPISSAQDHVLSTIFSRTVQKVYWCLFSQ